MPALGFSARTTYRAIEHATLRTFSNVKSSAITPRQPSVPNLIVLTVQQYMRSRWKRKVGLGKNELRIGFGWGWLMANCSVPRLMTPLWIDHKFQKVAIWISYVNAGASSLAAALALNWSFNNFCCNATQHVLK